MLYCSSNWANMARRFVTLAAVGAAHGGATAHMKRSKDEAAQNSKKPPRRALSVAICRSRWTDLSRERDVSFGLLQRSAFWTLEWTFGHANVCIWIWTKGNMPMTTVWKR